MRILVTGGAGYVGSTLCAELLHLGYHVRAMDNFHKGHCDALIPYCASPYFEFMNGDVSNYRDVEKAMSDVHAVVHLAGIVGFPACAKNPGLSYLVNVEGTKNILKAKPKDIPMFFASTGSVYGKVEDTCVEDSPTNPQSEYGIHKLEAEKAVVDTENCFAYRFATGFGVSPCMRVNLLINDLVYQAHYNKSLVIFQADFRRTFIRVDEMAESFLFGIQHYRNFKHKVYNVGSDQNNYTKREIAELIKSKTGCFVVYAEIGKDLDQRDYAVSYKRIEEEGLKLAGSVESGIDELLKVVKLLHIHHQYE